MNIKITEEIVVTINGVKTTATIEELKELRDKLNKVINRAPESIKVDNPDITTCWGGTECLTAATDRLKQLKEEGLDEFVNTLHKITETDEERRMLTKLTKAVDDFLDIGITVGDAIETMEDIAAPPILHEPRLDRALTRCILQAVIHSI